MHFKSEQMKGREEAASELLCFNGALEAVSWVWKRQNSVQAQNCVWSAKADLLWESHLMVFAGGLSQQNKSVAEGTRFNPGTGWEGPLSETLGSCYQPVLMVLS